jgi:Family of unknown function (DUF6153)
MIPTARAEVREARPDRLLVAVLFVVLAGVLGMHGLGSHGIGGLTHTAPTTHVAMGPGPGDVGLTVPSAATHAATHAAGPLLAAVLEGGDHHGMAMGLGQVCVAVLSALGLAVLLAGRRDSRGRVLPLAGAQMSRSPLPRGRDPDAPSVTQLSVLRR